MHQVPTSSGNPITDAATSSDRVSGHTHSFYRYPARFPPKLVSELINRFTAPGELVVDPFVGGGTTAVEARVCGRQFVGNDLNALAAFVTSVKSTQLSSFDLDEVASWLGRVEETMGLRNKTPFVGRSNSQFRNVNCRQTWPIRNALIKAVDSLHDMPLYQERFIRCVLLKSAQGALDGQKKIPTVGEFRARVSKVGARMIEDMREFSLTVSRADSSWICDRGRRSVILNRSTVGLESDPCFDQMRSPALVVTSPPYPGVHVLYHRWQVLGRRETPLPYWIANALDGDGLSYYTFGGRHLEGLPNYFANALRCFRSVSLLSDENTIVAQVVGFNEPDWQFSEYLLTMKQAGLEEVFFEDIANAPDGRLWRNVPNRKWFNQLEGGKHNAAVEVVLFHRKARESVAQN